MIVAWLWLKKYWQWLSIAAVLLLGFMVGVNVRKPAQSPNPEKKKAEEEAESDANEAEAEAAEAKADAQQKHDEDLAVVVDKVQETTEPLRDDVDRTNEYLKGVGKDIRGGD